MKQKFIIEPDISETETPFRFHEANAAQQEESQQILTKLLGKSKGKKRNAFNSSLMMSDSKDTVCNQFYFK